MLCGYGEITMDTLQHVGCQYRAGTRVAQGSSADGQCLFGRKCAHRSESCNGRHEFNGIFLPQCQP